MYVHMCVRGLCRNVIVSPLPFIHSLSSPPLSLSCRDHYYQYGEVRAIHMAAEQNCAFVTFSAREAAEAVRGRSDAMRTGGRIRRGGKMGVASITRGLHV